METPVTPLAHDAATVLKEALIEAQATLTQVRERRDQVADELAHLNWQLKEAAKEETVLKRLIARHEDETAATEEQP